MYFGSYISSLLFYCFQKSPQRPRAILQCSERKGMTGSTIFVPAVAGFVPGGKSAAKSLPLTECSLEMDGKIFFYDVVFLLEK